MPDLNLDLLEPNDNTITIAGETLKVHRVPLYVMLKAPDVYNRYYLLKEEEAAALSQEDVNKDFLFLVKCLGLVLKESGNEKPEEWILEHFDLYALYRAMRHILFIKTEKKRPEKSKPSTGAD